MNNPKNIKIDYETLKRWWIKGDYKYNSIHFPTQKYPNGFISDGRLKIIHFNKINDIVIRYELTRKDTIKHQDIYEEIHFEYIKESDKIKCFIENSLGSFSNNIDLIKFTDEQIILKCRNYNSETLNETLIDKRKFIINKKKYGYFIEDIIKLNKSWVGKGYSKYKLIDCN